MILGRIALFSALNQSRRGIPINQAITALSQIA
jgi:hypothetical protein